MSPTDMLIQSLILYKSVTKLAQRLGWQWAIGHKNCLLLPGFSRLIDVIIIIIHIGKY